MDCHVYIDRKPDGTPFYVGIGPERRVKDPIRNRWHSRICKKYPNWTRTIIETTPRELCGEFEELLIAEIGRLNLGKGPLVNLTDGNDRVWGLKHTKKSKAKISASGRGKKRSEETKNRQRLAALALGDANGSKKPEVKALLSTIKRGRIWVTDGQTSKMIHTTQSLPSGWRLGRIVTPKMEIASRISVEAASSSVSGSVWVTNGSTSKRVSKGDVETFISQGFKVGRLSWRHQ